MVCRSLFHDLWRCSDFRRQDLQVLRPQMKLSDIYAHLRGRKFDLWSRAQF